MSKRGLRILIVTTDFPPGLGGIQEWVFRVASCLAEHHHVCVIAPRQPGWQACDARLPFRVRRVPTSTRLPLSLASLTATALWQIVCRRPAVLLFPQLFAGVGLYRFCRIASIPYVLVAHGHEVQARRLQRFLRPLVDNSYTCIAVSRVTAATLNATGIREGKVIYIPNGVAGTFLSDSSSPQAIARLHISAETRVIVTVARLAERYKGHDMLIRALPLMLQRVPDLVYVIAGDGKFRQEYEDLARSLGVAAHVLFAGRVTDAERLALYDRCDLFAMISRREPDGRGEGFPLVFFEAAARGKPSVGGDSGGIPDAVSDGVTGLLVDPLDIEAIAQACLRLLTEEGLARGLGEAGRKRVQEAYTWGHIARRIEVQLQEAACSPGKAS